MDVRLLQSPSPVEGVTLCHSLSQQLSPVAADMDFPLTVIWYPSRVSQPWSVLLLAHQKVAASTSCGGSLDHVPEVGGSTGVIVLDIGWEDNIWKH